MLVAVPNTGRKGEKVRVVVETLAKRFKEAEG
jgi:hypothetical protein